MCKILLPVIAIVFFLYSCSSSLPPEYKGQWSADKVDITVRVKGDNGHSRYISDSATIKFHISSDNKASGNIGTAKFENALLKRNFILPWEKGVIFMIECGSIGKIFDSDPLESKEVELWISKINDRNRLHATLRYTKGGSYFPMADVLFIRVPE